MTAASLDLGEIVAVLTLAIAIGGLVWHASSLATRLKELERWRERHEPTTVELAELKVMIGALAASLTDVKADIQRLYERSNRGTRT